ncbi:oxidoreductase [Cavenderia fasciculata]|uniref:Oxidoreductase n=1 Tax=Cavenderia fasciculata TaxID=261658 RepID=F4Q1B5_CACFS|nr:oxidoreductase [Cavenderia fasciculata]EGG18616.1 oxidoreductase [Cavenderia fasciculata]|eukprot:XP_004366520.1 oxidoreductase [Cavenderia fasciculata]
MYSSSSSPDKDENDLKVSESTYKLPIIDLKSFKSGEDREKVAKEINDACKRHGFFYIAGHGIEEELIDRLDSVSRQFFALDEQEKLKIRMELGGSAWRGYFPLGGELTSNRPDWKEGLYFGTELQDTHPLVVSKTPVHGRNLFPDESMVPTMSQIVLEYIEKVTQLGHVVMEAIALSLGVPSDYFYSLYTQDPLILFRIFNYRSQVIPDGMDVRWGVGEHTDYGLLTILYQDDIGGLQVKVGGEGWIKAPPIKNTFVCNIGDMLDRMTGGLYKSTPHRVALNTSGRHRLSFPLFFDPNFFTQVQPIDGISIGQDDSHQRWDKSNVHEFQGTYGDYLINKVSQVFPQLKQNINNTQQQRSE